MRIYHQIDIDALDQAASLSNVRMFRQQLEVFLTEYFNRLSDKSRGTLVRGLMYPGMNPRTGEKFN